jgi:hypothetical protein
MTIAKNHFNKLLKVVLHSFYPILSIGALFLFESLAVGFDSNGIWKFRICEYLQFLEELLSLF